MSDFKTYTRICVDCGKVLCNVGRSAQRCPECGKKHANARAAEKAGLSYGKYMLQKMQADKKARRCANTDEPKG